MGNRPMQAALDQKVKDRSRAVMEKLAVSWKATRRLGGRAAGTPNLLPGNSFKAMKELIAGRILKTLKDDEGQDVAKTAAEVMADAILDGMMGRLILSQSDKGTTIANPLHAVKLFHDYMLKAKELALKAAEIKKKETGAGGGIRIVLPSVPADPLLRPGQKPRPLRLLGQDPSKPIEYYQDQHRCQGTESRTSTASHEPLVAPATNARGDVAQKREVSQPRAISPSKPPPSASEPEDFEAQLIEDFEHPICWNCLGATMVRDPEFGIKMVTCNYCGGAGRAPAPE
jgi:hypothetical protein